MRSFLLFLLVVVTCIYLFFWLFLSPPHRFFVITDDDVKQVILNLNDETSNMHNIAVFWYDSMDMGDAGGIITAIYADGTQVVCEIDYITGSEIQPNHFQFSDKKCVD